MDATFWATVALVLFIALIVYLKVPGKVGSSLDERANRIRRELDEAKRLRQEAEAVLAEYQRKRREAEAEAAQILTLAKADAERMTVEANAALEEMIRRRTAAAEAKIAQAEGQAVAAVKARATDVAIAAARHVLADKVKGGVADRLVEDGIATAKARLN
jgi:F-type H+-transporting ATPase subunit b